MVKLPEGKEAGKMKECTYWVEGMHCPSCELLIEKGVLENKEIKSAEASTSEGKVVVYYQGKKTSVKRLNNQFEKQGYFFSERPILQEVKAPLFSLNNNGQLLINKKALWRNTQIFGLALLLITGFLLMSRSGVASRVVVNSSSNVLALFLFGLMAGVSSCAALVGGIVLSMSKQWAELYQGKSSVWQKFQPHLLFNLGRLLSFAILGGMLGALGAFFRISLSAMALLAMAVSIIMVLLASQMLGIKRFQKFQLTTPKFIARFAVNEDNLKGRYMPFVIGALTFFLPCGFTITAQGLALASGSSLRGLMVMLFFALGTLPMLSAIGFSTLKLTAKPHLSGKFLKVAGILVLFFGLYNFNSQLNVLGLPSLDDIKFRSSKSAQATESGLAPIINGKQVLKMSALAYAYQPNYFKVRAGVPVRWEITDDGVSGCTNAIISKGLFAGEIDLTTAQTSIKEFTPKKPGRYKFSCWMGMVSGAIEVLGENDVVGTTNFNEEIPSGASGCGGEAGGGCTGGCGGGCGNSGCPYAK